MLKDITLGQYFPGDTLVHRLDPRTKLTVVVLYYVLIFTASSPLTMLLAVGSLALSVYISRIPPRSLLKGLKPLMFLVILTGLLNLFYTDGQVLVRFWVFRITREGIFRSIQMVMRITLLVCGTFLLTYTTSPLSITDGLERILGPFRKLGLPVHELSMMMSIALRFIPTLIEETDKIMSAQKARGADFDTGSIFKRVKALLPVLVPLFVSAFRRADELATAMECRCYHGGEGRTALHVLHYKTADWLTLAGFVALAAGVIVLGKFGL